MFHYYKEMQNENVILFLNGFIDQNLLVSCLDLIRGSLEKNYIRVDTIKKLFFIIIEFSQNIMRYSAERLNNANEDKKIGKGMLTICENMNSIILTAGNVIYNNKVQFLRDLCDKINKMDKNDLKKFYKERLAEESIKERYTANIGLIHIVRKTGYPLNYKIKQVNDEKSFFTVSINVDKSKKGKYFKL